MSWFPCQKPRRGGAAVLNTDPALGRNCTVPFEHVARRMGVRLGRSELGHASVHEEFASGDEAAVAGGEETDRLCDIGGSSIPPDGGGVGGLGEKAGQLG